MSDEKHTQIHQSLLKNYHEGMQKTIHTVVEAKEITSPSANINETENEQEVPPFKPMIIKSNSQAIGGGYECKTTTKKSPSGLALEKINALKEAMSIVNIQAKMPSSTTNK